MKLSIIGMAGSGKTYWAKNLEKEGYQRFTIDDFIAKKLGLELTKHGYSGINDLAKWMGQPYEPHYAERCDRYLELEIESMDEVYEKVAAMKETDNVVIDTTGSLIYLGAATIHTLGELTKVIYLETPDAVQDEMYKQYLTNLKPVVWGKSFYIVDGETPEQALARCYPELLSYRIRKYERYAHVTFDYHLMRTEQFTTRRFLDQASQ